MWWKIGSAQLVAKRVEEAASSSEFDEPSCPGQAKWPMCVRYPVSKLNGTDMHFLQQEYEASLTKFSLKFETYAIHLCKKFLTFWYCPIFVTFLRNAVLSTQTFSDLCNVFHDFRISRFLLILGNKTWLAKRVQEVASSSEFDEPSCPGQAKWPI